MLRPDKDLYNLTPDERARKELFGSISFKPVDGAYARHDGSMIKYSDLVKLYQDELEADMASMAAYTKECEEERAMFAKMDEQEVEVSDYETSIWNAAIEAAAKKADIGYRTGTEIRKLKK